MPSGIAAVSATIFSSFAINSHIVRRKPPCRSAPWLHDLIGLPVFRSKGPGRVPRVVIVFRCRKAFAFGRQRVNDDRAVLDLLRFVERCNQRSRIVAVDVADVFEAQFVDERAGQDRRRDRILHRLRRVMQRSAERGNREQRLFHFIFETVIALRFANAIEIARQRADRRRDRHLVVV